MNCADWLCIVNKAISATSPDAQETLVLVILTLFAASALLGLVVALFLLVRTPIGAIMKRRRAASGREPEMSPIERLLLQQQRNNESMLQTIHDLISQNVLQTNAVVALGNELKKVTDIEEKRATMHETDLKSISDNSLALAETIANQGAQIAKQIDSTTSGLTTQISSIRGQVSNLHTKADSSMVGLNMLKQRGEQIHDDDKQAISALQRVIIDRIDQLPAQITNEVKPLFAEWSDIRTTLNRIADDLTRAEMKVVNKLETIISREALLKGLADGVPVSPAEPPSAGAGAI